MHGLIGQPTADLERLASSLGAAPYRGRQLASWLYRRQAATWDAMTDLPADLKARLADGHTLRTLRVDRRDAAADGAVKFLMALPDGEVVESVYLPYDDRVSVCVSTQAGCAMGCRFCATGLGGFARDLTSGEIVEQVLVMQAEMPGRRISHVVYMGMGEPMLNYDATVASLRLLAGEVGISARSLTVSTVGVPPAMRALAGEDLPVTLALSLHAPDDALRERLMPVARKWPIAEVLDACAEYHRRTRRNLTFEYLLLAGVNDSIEQARMLARVLRRLPGNVNLIPFNHVDTAQGFRRPEIGRVTAFRAALEASGRTVTQRVERGHAISAACGQLRRAVLAAPSGKSAAPGRL